MKRTGTNERTRKLTNLLNLSARNEDADPGRPDLQEDARAGGRPHPPPALGRRPPLPGHARLCPQRSVAATRPGKDVCLVNFS